MTISPQLHKAMKARLKKTQVVNLPDSVLMSPQNSRRNPILPQGVQNFKPRPTQYQDTQVRENVPNGEQGKPMPNSDAFTNTEQHQQSRQGGVFIADGMLPIWQKLDEILQELKRQRRKE